MKLYETAMTPSCKRVSIFLKEIGGEVERVALNVREGDNLSESFKQKSVNGKVPLLELDDGTTICESVAICRYLDEAFENDLALFGANQLERAQVEMWHRVVEFQGLYAAFQAFRNITAIYQDRENCVTAWGEESKSRVLEFLPTLDKRLSESEYIGTNQFSIVDITGYIFIGFAVNGLSIEVFEKYPNIARWFEQVSARDAFQS
ncbi:glutathione S-transferase [Vibrio parahaemolyticus]|uniref:glutathione S-transferase n=1 Tax=Vibrio parahaemolyticus TaxID=670 RepID=UPI0003590B13|nr:glutathione S-transferase [Vibrio parahaemolyticus]AGQ96593.1 glutathione S-transferase [Vibrio parahaemolyticus O1:K33 str. CDC_K4557]EGQ7894455.1 glutathione S-transferase [Vibrio parahaemolyticus]EGQ8480919.1 glutathione S-transferase [Vibrio parahaemolyticus]EGQ9152198.1 glutathione S-transferase [Vibrio parahaemolyticus]EGQ9887868.1 glutathione S-transferase [Vibrio parahaemolyticus]